MFVPVFLDLLLVWIAIFSLLLCVQTRRQSMAVWLGILLLMPAIVSYNRDLLFNGGMGPLTHWLLACALLAGAVVALGWHSLGEALRRAVDFALTVILFFGIGGLLVLGQLTWYGWQARGLNKKPDSQGTSAGPAKSGRIIWIVFDELSYQQVYERRFHGLALPAFDGLAANANVFTQTIPAGYFTDRVMPSLMSGRSIDVVRSSASGALWFHDRQAGVWRPFDANDTVFEDAVQRGYRTSVAGWYVPYCRLLSKVLDGCFWSYDIPLKNGMSSRQSLRGNMLAPFLYAVNDWVSQPWLARLSHLQNFGVYAGEMHIRDYQDIFGAAEAALRNRSDDFVLLHFPIPHFSGIYNRATGQLTTGPSTYLDNLALADRCFGHLRGVLEETGQWDSSIVVVMGDHSWRVTQEVPDSPTLQTEEIEASHGRQFDPRPFYVVKLAGQRAGTRIDTPFSAVNTRSLLDAIMGGSIRTPEDLKGEVRRLH